MKSISIVLSIIIGSTVYANDACFNDPAVQRLIQESSEIDECFDREDSQCAKLIPKMSVPEQRELNGQRLVPFNRASNELINRAVGRLRIEFAEGAATATAEKISRCHLITSAHALYKKTKVPVSSADLKERTTASDFDISFAVGQTCTPQAFEATYKARVFFAMTKEGADFNCDLRDKAGMCLERHFHGKSDLVILKLEQYDKSQQIYFKVATKPLSIPAIGMRVNCWGYPGYNNQLSKLPRHLSDRMLWLQRNAKIFPGNFDRGVITNAIGYPGMSGGGCVTPEAGNVLLGILTDNNSLTGHSAILLSDANADARSGNFVSLFEHLEKRFIQATEKSLGELDRDCD